MRACPARVPCLAVQARQGTRCFGAINLHLVTTVVTYSWAASTGGVPSASPEVPAKEPLTWSCLSRKLNMVTQWCCHFKFHFRGRNGPPPHHLF